MKKKTKKLIILTVSVVVILIFAVLLFVGYNNGSRADEITEDEATKLISDALTAVADDGLSRKSLTYISDNSGFTIKKIRYGNSKNIIVECTINSVDIYDAVIASVPELFSMDTKDKNGMEMTSTKIRLLIDGNLLEIIKSAPAVKYDAEIEIFQTDSGFDVYTPSDIVDMYYGKALSVKTAVNKIETVTVKGEEKKVNSNLRNGLIECIKVTSEVRRPDTATGVAKIVNNIIYQFKRNFIEDNNWKYIADGLIVTLEITALSAVFGALLGFIVAIIRCTYDKTGALSFLNSVCKLYLTIIRGTPVVVQLMIIFFVIFMPLKVNEMVAAVVCFSVNSGAYVAEIVRGGIMSIDEGQFEAGRSLGLNYSKTMIYIILPQTFKTVLPSLANEFIALIKETSVVSFIGINDLARGGYIIRGLTYSAFMPLLAVAAVYLVLVVGFSKIVSLIERRLRNSEK